MLTLGVVLTDDLTWSEHINQITNKAKKAVGFIYRQFYNMSSKSSLLQLYNKTSSGVCITSMGLESVQKFALKMCIKNWSSSYSENLEACSLPELTARRKYLSLCYFYKLANGSFEFPNCPTTLRQTTTHVAANQLYIPSLMFIVIRFLFFFSTNCIIVEFVASKCSYFYLN